MELNELFRTEASVIILFLHASILYLGILFLMRILPCRTGGELAMMDLIFVILIAEAATHAFGNYTSMIEGFIVIGTLISWNVVINMLSYRFRWIERLVPASQPLFMKERRLLRRNMRWEFTQKRN